MRFNSLSIPAFGPFTEFKLEFPKEESDVHLIYGPNEAGKSSLLRAIEGLLYGIPMRSTDDFKHEHKKFLIGAKIADAKKELEFFRRKGRKNTLLAADGATSLEPGELKAFLGEVDEAFFKHMFGLSTESLREGAKLLLSGDSDLGKLIFSANLGGGAVDQAIKTLEEEADSLFRERASTKLINQALKAFASHEKASRDLSISASAWDKLMKEIESAQTDFKSVDQEQITTSQKKAHLERLSQAIPVLKKRQALKADLDEITLPELPTNFAKSVQDATSRLQQAAAVADQNTSARDNKAQQLKELPEFDAILEDKVAIESLHQHIGSHQERIVVQAESESQLAQKSQALETALTDLDLDDAEQLAQLPDLTKPDLSRIQARAEALQSAENSHRTGQADLEKSQTRLDQEISKLTDLGDSDLKPELEVLDQRIKDHLAHSSLREKLEKEARKQSNSLDQLTRELGLSSFSRDQIRQLQVPSTSLIADFTQRHETYLQEQKQQREAAANLEQRLTEIEHELKVALEGEKKVVSESDLQASRQERDALWQQLRQHLEQGSKAETKQIEALPSAIKNADQISDTLREDATQMAHLLKLQNEGELVKSKLQKLGDQSKTSAASVEKLLAEAATKTNFIEGRNLRLPEVQDWLETWELWQQIDSQLTDQEQELESADTQQQNLTADLKKELGTEDDSLDLLAVKLTQIVNQTRSNSGARTTIEKSIEQLKLETRTLENQQSNRRKALSDATEDWEKCIAAQSLPSDEEPSVILTILQARRHAKELQQELEQLEAERRTRAETIKRFTTQLRELHNSHLPQLSFDETQPAKSVAALWDALESARSAETRSKQLQADIEELEERINQQAIDQKAAESLIETLIHEAHIDSAEQLSGVVHQLERRHRLQSQFESTNDTLIELARGKSTDDFVAEIEQAEPDRIDEQIAQLSSELDQLKQSRDEALSHLNAKLAERRTLEQVNDDAANAKQLAANDLATVVTHSERFIRLQHAVHFLKAQVERFREQAQGPMIQRTSEFFSKLTLGAFSGVAAQSDEDDPKRIQLVALRPKNDQDSDAAPPEHVPTSGLSEGTCDQLYLALRLAAIDLHLENHAPMPLILDDVLMTFDDARTQALLELLIPFSQKTQVIIFTHHPHTQSLAKAHTPAVKLQKL